MYTMKNILYLFLLVAFTFPAFAQQATNVALTTTDDKIIVAYDLVGKKNTLYKVDLKFRLANGELLQPKTINGDVGKVESGTGKAIIWDLYKDVNGLSGSIEPELAVTAIQAKKKNDKALPTPNPPAPNRPTIDIQNDDKIQKINSATRFGFKVGLGRTGVASNLRTNSFHRKFSYEAGLFFRWHKWRRFYIQPEILYHLQQYEERYNLEENAFTKHHWLRGQAIAGIAPFGMGLYFNGGLYYGYMMGGNEKQMLETETIITNINDFVNVNGEDSPFNRQDAGFILGGTLSIKKGAFALGVLYSQSFESFINEAYYNGDPENGNLKLRNNGVHFYFQRAF